MTRFITALPLSLVLAAPALAGPPITTQGPGDGVAPMVGESSDVELDVECQVNGRTERYTIRGDILVGHDGVVIEMAQGNYRVALAEGNLLLSETRAQISGGPDVGKWDCVAATGPVPTPGSVADDGAMAALEQRLATMRAALEASQEDLVTAVAERNAAHAALEEMRAARTQDAAEIASLERELAESLSAEARAQAAMAEAQAQVEAGAAARAELEARLAAAEARSTELEGTAAGASEAQAQIARLEDQVVTLEAELARAERDMAALQAEVEEAQAASAMEDATEDSTEAGLPTFDADAALEMVEGAEIGAIAREALVTAIEQARNNPAMGAEVMARLQAVLGE